MKPLVKATLVSALSLAAMIPPISAAATNDAMQDAVLVDRIVAVVDDRIILKSELNTRLLEKSDALAQQNIPVTDVDALREQVLESLITEAVQLSRAELTGLKISDQELNEQMEKIAAENKMTLLELRNRLNLEVDDGFNKMRNKIKTQMLIQKLRQRDVISRVQVTESEIENYLKRKTLANKYREINLRHILVALPESANQKQRQEALKKIDDIRQRAVSGEDFAQLAVRYSNGSRALEGGDLGWMNDSQVPTFFAKEVNKLELGEISEVIQSPSGFHLIQIADQRQAGTQKVSQFHLYRFLVLSDGAMSQAQAPVSIQQAAANINSLEDFKGLQEKFADIPKEVNANNDMGWRSGEDIAPNLQELLVRINVGQAMQPVATDRGWMIYYLDGIRTVNEDAADKREEAAKAVQMRKANEMFDLWLRRLRDEAYVRIEL
ncbi:peptidylprolyl isomerase [Thiomicrorhabdus sp. 6S2-11]|uniref:Chaperone SurA n=1 Tax=Thiomicrorhabdus marina TaxID=2818442 RepID=A0ABS3Q1M9_9GAMM|nr:peptidylprolyl isomerase [Thiomicrorhabdus marina]MBO1926220.1 peptidylprolyl isomerase [Thiomicrorhabdus marina]